MTSSSLKFFVIVTLVPLLVLGNDVYSPCTSGTFQIGCSQCSCTSDGRLGECTKVSPCSVQDRAIIKCPVGVKFKLDCNNCTCTDGKGAVCTREGCSDKCSPVGQPFDIKTGNDGCGACACTRTGDPFCLCPK